MCAVKISGTQTVFMRTKIKYLKIVTKLVLSGCSVNNRVTIFLYLLIVQITKHAIYHVSSVVMPYTALSALPRQIVYQGFINEVEW